MEKTSSYGKLCLILILSFDVALLAVFKYLPVILKALGAEQGLAARLAGMHTPIGISFFTFQLMSYVLDVRSGRVGLQKKLPDFALYISMFPQLVAGPIVRYGEIAGELRERRESFDNLCGGMERFICGLGKKVLLADFLARTADAAFTDPETLSVCGAWFGAVSYALQIYYDFSGYSDMAIGLGRMFGFHFGENFRYPYMASSCTDFWRRWHISLSSWFRDYVYIPLGGSRRGRRRQILNLLVVWLLTGIWHGANWTFLLWGLLWFTALFLEKMTGRGEKNSLLSHFGTLLIILAGWVLFRSPDLAGAGVYLGKMLGIGAQGIWNPGFLESLRKGWMVCLLGCVGATPFVGRMGQRLRTNGFGWTAELWQVFVFLLAVIEIIVSNYQPFIYFNF